MNILMASKEAVISWINDYRYQFSASNCLQNLLKVLVEECGHNI